MHWQHLFTAALHIFIAYHVNYIPDSETRHSIFTAVAVIIILQYIKLLSNVQCV